MRLSSLLWTIVDRLACREARPERSLVPGKMAPDEHRLVLGHSGQLHPGQLRAPARDVEQALPVAASEADDALRPHHVAREPADESLEPAPIEPSGRTVDEAGEA